MPLLEELQTQLICLRRLGDQASDAATAALLHYKKATVPQLKADIRAAGVEVRV